MDIENFIINFEKYCCTCEFSDMAQYEDPCHECLGTPVRQNHHLPINYKKRQKKVENKIIKNKNK